MTSFHWWDSSCCLFARHAWKSETLLFGLVSEENTTADLVALMQSLVARTHQLPEEERLYSPLLLIFQRRNLNSLEEAQRFGWQQLHLLSTVVPRRSQVDRQDLVPQVVPVLTRE